MPIETICKSPKIAGMLGIFDCSGVSDGSAAAILCRAEDAHKYTQHPIFIKALSFSAGPAEGYFSQDYDFTTFPEVVNSSQDAYKQAGVKDRNKFRIRGYNLPGLNPVVYLGARPVFCDIDPATFNMDPAKLGAAVTPKTKCIQPVHLYGQCADMDPILDVAKAKGIPVIEDACQSLGAGYKGKKAGALGDFGAFSFFPSKNLGGFGDGGMVTTDDDTHAARLRALRMHGETSRYHHKLVGGNFRLDALQAAILHVKLPHLDGWARARRRNAAEIEGLYLEAGGGGYEEGGLKFPRQAAGREHVFNQFVVHVGKGRRDALKKLLDERQIGNAIYYPVPLHLQECFASLGGRPGDCPEAEKAAGETLALPVFPELTQEQKAFLAFTLAEFFRG